MPRKLRELRRDLRRDGWYLDRQRGTSHQTWKHDLALDFPIVLAGHDGADAKDYQEKLVHEGQQRTREARRKKGH
ncbi:MAG: type II toxin-antitoxin system HicA family toxin [Ktedonobacterales bacterium]